MTGHSASSRPRRWPTLVVVVAAALGGLGGCSDDAPEATAPPSSPLPSVAVSTPTKDGQEADAAKVAAVVARLTDPLAVSAPLGVDGTRTFFRLQMIGLGLAPDDATCVAEKLVAASGDDAGTKSLGEVMASNVGFDPVAISQCLTPDELQQLSASTPDMSRVPADELRAFLLATGVSSMASAGLSSEEATCVAESLLAGVPADQLGGVLGGGLELAERYPEAVASCMTAARIDELAAR